MHGFGSEGVNTGGDPHVNPGPGEGEKLPLSFLLKPPR